MAARITSRPNREKASIIRYKTEMKNKKKLPLEDKEQQTSEQVKNKTEEERNIT